MTYLWIALGVIATVILLMLAVAIFVAAVALAILGSIGRAFYSRW